MDSTVEQQALGSLVLAPDIYLVLQHREINQEVVCCFSKFWFNRVTMGSTLVCSDDSPTMSAGFNFRSQPLLQNDC